MPKKVCIRLSPQERRSLKHQYKVEKHPKMKERCQMLLLSDSGRGIGEIADIIGKTSRRVSDILHDYEQSGIKGISLKPQPGNHRKLTKEQRKKVTALLKHTPGHSGINTSFWSIQAVQTLVKEKFHILYATPDSYRALLYESGFSFHKTEKRYREQNPEKVRKWLIDSKKN